MGRATRNGPWMSAPPIVPPTPVVVVANLPLRPSPFAAGTFSRLAIRQRTHVILTSGERRLQPSPRGRRRDPSTIHPSKIIGPIDFGH
ncbi:unnamed protein product [Lasius platythorax]|uniref:Uncharacterized protein n=1 Tax=Lasius platythorax TaxID=488582 RepID=A0AAV2P2N6_9HYME